jgi:hypothetical protein
MSWPTEKDKNMMKRIPSIHIPIPKFLGVDSKRGFFLALVALLAPKGAAAGFFPDPGLALGGWSLRRSQQSNP